MSDHYVRAFPGRTGQSHRQLRSGMPLAEVREMRGFDQILWLDGYEFNPQEIGTRCIWSLMMWY